jgi:hypothetical protein
VTELKLGRAKREDHPRGTRVLGVLQKLEDEVAAVAIKLLSNELTNVIELLTAATDVLLTNRFVVSRHRYDSA